MLTESVVPGQPTSLHVRPQSNSIHVRWTAPAERGIKIRGYVLGYGVGIPDVFRQVLDAGQRHHTIRALRQYTVEFSHYRMAQKLRPPFLPLPRRRLCDWYCLFVIL